MKNHLLLFISLLFFSSLFAKNIEKPIPNVHEGWNMLLETHVDNIGMVDYVGFKKSTTQLNSYLKEIESTYLSTYNKWNKNHKLAFWINIYNAYTVKLILDHYPIKSIKDITKDGKDAWNIPFIKLGNKTYTLNQIENDIIRKQFNEPRIHFAVNCASIGCPPLRNEAFMADKLDQQLQEQTKKFVNDNSRNILSTNSIKISKIFEWYNEDFTKDGSLTDFLNKYALTPINNDASIRYLDYDWGLNKQN